MGSYMTQNCIYGIENGFANFEYQQTKLRKTGAEESPRKSWICLPPWNLLGIFDKTGFQKTMTIWLAGWLLAAGWLAGWMARWLVGWLANEIRATAEQQ